MLRLLTGTLLRGVGSSIFAPATVAAFGRVKGPKPTHLKKKEKTRSAALSDEKAAKLSKAEEDAEAKRKKIEQERIKQERLRRQKLPKRTFDVSFEARPVAEIPPKISHNIPATPNNIQLVKKPSLTKKVIHKYFNTEDIVNRAFIGKVKQVEPRKNSQRTGLLAIKVGMSFLWDRWGKRHALTVLQVDRCQVVQVKTPEKEGYYALQLGVGDRNPKRLRKPEIGHFLRAGTPAKQELHEFPVTPENLLPVGYQLGARHFTPGQYVDTNSLTRGKGFQGAMKRWGFAGGPASHGASLFHRGLGATGARQDPGRVFKNKKMHGRMGGRRRMQRNLRVYKVDADRCLIYIKGSVPGRTGSVIKIMDAERKKEQNAEFLNYPTFVPDPSKQYAVEMIMDAPEEDPEEVYIHDNAIIPDEYMGLAGPVTQAEGDGEGGE
eukprot:TRINITY_DN1494_c0_g1_i5.p1 TRINITY_DN1494_c0_g1~~TRINITY_DN1494_c0_g1_i5.p1  ORF type:complete len:435 (+),score=120.40 TRINITY_DN1494_c0_g1_i5:1335-2639(+)